MCVLVVAWHMSDRWPVVVVANRDEFHTRAALPVGRWDDTDVIAGRDLLSGGTWLGVSGAGRLAAVTNVRSTSAPRGASRGSLVVDYLTRPATESLDRNELFNPYNLLTIANGVAAFSSNYPRVVQSTLAPGLHTLGNDVLFSPSARSAPLNLAIADWLSRGAADPLDLFEALAMDGTDPHEMGSGNETGPARSLPAFIRDPDYGTRCSTVITVDARGHGQIVEHSFDEAGTLSKDVHYQFTWPITA